MIIGGYMDGFGSQKKILEIRANSWGGLGVVDWQELDQELQNPRYGHVVIPVCEGKYHHLSMIWSDFLPYLLENITLYIHYVINYSFIIRILINRPWLT